jgi:ABC-type sugar transport system ATPase subunit
MSDARDKVLAREVCKRFDETVALSDCSLTINPGEVHAIVGENGSGKSTLAKIFSGVVLPDSGAVSIFGERPRSPMHARALGVATIFQEVLVAETLPVVDNIFVGTDGLWTRSRTRAEACDQTRDILKRFTGSDINPDTLVQNLPLSAQQWIVIVRALLANPRLLILDESSAALDLDATARLHIEIKKRRDAGCCVVIVTHRIAELIRVADRATVLRDGAVVGELVGADIKEANLLRMMSAKQVTPESLAKPPPLTGHRNRDVLLAARGINIEPTATPFDFYLHAGEIVGATGLDGQGHVDFLQAIAGLRPPLAGSVFVEDRTAPEPVRDLSEAVASGIAYVSGDRAHDGIFPNLSIFENFALPFYRSTFGEFGWIDPRPLERAFVEQARRLSIKVARASNAITSLSGGNQQKVLIARALASSPRIIVLDDPARGVDIGTKQELYAQLKEFAGRGGAVVYLSSEIEEFFDFADRVLVFRNRTLFMTVSSANFSEEALLAAMFGDSDASTLSTKTEGLLRI